MRKKEFYVHAIIVTLYTWWLMDAFFEKAILGILFWGTLLGFKLRRVYLTDKLYKANTGNQA
ncbi:MAG: hypothetical protein LBS33_01365 [Streptococcaceae bacterium]|jgi:hypothetical protein|nr:hypothetical protein [Streptococcaceae bacterium]